MILTKPRRYVTPMIRAHVPPELFAAARRALGLPESSTKSDVIRGALAVAGGVSLDAYPLAKRGPKPGQGRKGKAA
jgi:hypothetical protein